MTKRILIRALKWAFGIQVFLYLLVFISMRVMSVHSSLFELIFMLLFPGIMTLKACFPFILDGKSFIWVFILIFLFQTIYIWLMLLILFYFLQLKKNKNQDS